MSQYSQHNRENEQDFLQLKPDGCVFSVRAGSGVVFRYESNMILSRGQVVCGAIGI